jgi:hypothetical protein
MVSCGFLKAEHPPALFAAAANRLAAASTAGEP